MSVVLAEPAHAGEPSERARQLVPVQGPEVGPAQGEFPPRAEPLLEHEAKHRRGRVRTCSVCDEGLEPETGDCSHELEDLTLA